MTHIKTRFLSVFLMASAADRVPLVTPEPTPNTNVASTSYVQGAYNVLGKAINAIDTDLSDNYATKEELSDETNARTTADTALDNRVTTAEGKISTAEGKITALETTVGDASSGLVKDVADLQNSANTYQAKSDSTVAAKGNYINAGTGVAANLTALDTQVKTNADAIATKAAATDLTALGNRVTAAEGDISGLKTADTELDGRLDTLEAAGYITKDVNDLTNYTTTTGMNTAISNAVATETDAREAADTALQTSIDAKANSADVYTRTEADARFDATGAAATAETNAKAYADAKLLTVYTTWNTTATDTTTLSNPVANPAANQGA